MARREARRIDQLIEEAEQALDEDDLQRAEALTDHAIAMVPEHPTAWLLKGDLLVARGDREGAALAYRRSALAAPELGPGWAALGLCLFELLRVDEAQAACNRALRSDPDCAEAWWVRSLLREWKGDADGAERARAHARFLDPEEHSSTQTLDDAEVDRLVTEALMELPTGVRDALAEIVIVVQAMPDEATCRSYDPPASPLELLGCFHGSSLMDRSHHDPWSQLPGEITLYKGNLARMAADREELIEQLRITLLHEIGHFLGLDEEDLERRGLD